MTDEEKEAEIKAIVESFMVPPQMMSMLGKSNLAANMTKRERFAMEFMAAIIRNGGNACALQHKAKEAVKAADALIKELENEVEEELPGFVMD